MRVLCGRKVVAGGLVDETGLLDGISPHIAWSLLLRALSSHDRCTYAKKHATYFKV